MIKIYFFIVLLLLLFCQIHSVYSSCVNNNQVIPSPSNRIEFGSNSVCFNATQPIVAFTASTANLPFNFLYTVNGGATLTMYSSTFSSKVNFPFNIAGFFIHILLPNTDTAGLLKSVNESVIVTVYNSPCRYTQINGTGEFMFCGNKVFLIYGNSTSVFGFVNTATTVITNTT